MFVQDEIERQGSVLVDYADLTGDRTVRGALPDIVTELREQPEVMLNCLGVAIHQVHTHGAVTELAAFQNASIVLHTCRRFDLALYCIIINIGLN